MPGAGSESVIEEGIVQLVQSDAGVKAIAPLGGFLVQLPKDQTLPSWAYSVVSKVPNTSLQSARGLAMLRLQIDCDGSAPDVIQLAAAIDNVLHGYQGTLPDPDHTYVSCCFQSDTKDFFDDAGRTLRRMLEYEILFS